MSRRHKPLCEVGELKFYKQEQIDLSVPQQLPTYKYVIERYFTENADITLWPKNMVKRQHNIIYMIANELIYIWIHMNVIPLSRNTVVAMVEKLIVKEFITEIKERSESKRKGIWKTRYLCLVEKLDDGFDIRRKDLKRSKEIAAYFGPEITEEEENLYKDNCMKNENGKCPRLVWCGGVDMVWEREAKKRRERMERSKEFARQREIRIQREREKILAETSMDSVSTVAVQLDDDENNADSISEDDEFRPGKKSAQHPKRTFKTSKSPETRGSGKAQSVGSDEVGKDEQFPKIEVRTGLRNFNVNVMECLVVIQSVYKVDARKTAPLLCYIANTLFGQEWVAVDEDIFDKGQEEIENEIRGKKRKKFNHPLNFTLPTRKTLGRWVEDFSSLNLKATAEAIVNAHKGDRVVTYGCDDSVKAAGNNRLDIKTARVTIIGDDNTRESYSTGFHHNLSHSGKDSARIVSHDIAKLAVLTGHDYNEMLTLIDFFMTDRAGDSDVMLDELGVASDKRLKCNAHILLAIDVAIDKIFKDTEVIIGLSTLIGRGAEHVFNSSKNSIWYLGLIAIAKLLSPSHSKESISLYMDYKKFLKNNIETGNDMMEASQMVLGSNFKGFQSNRFGRIGELSKAVTVHNVLIGAFFEEQVDENQNKLVLAVATYLQSEWFLLCSKVASFFFEKITLQFKASIGIDEFKSQNKMTSTIPREAHNWTSIKLSLEVILKDLQVYAESSTDNITGEELLRSRCASQIKEAIERQMSRVDFFNDNEEATKINKAPCTNLGPESNFASLDVDLKRSGNSTNLATVSDKHIIEKNKLHTRGMWIKLSDEEKTKEWKWARSSSEVKQVKAMENDLKEFLESVSVLAVEAKKTKKLKQKDKIMKALENCKSHGGPITPSDIEKLDSLTEDQVKCEVAYLKLTSGSSLRYRRKVGNKFVNFTVEELRTQIHNVIKPTSDLNTDINHALQRALSN